MGERRHGFRQVDKLVDEKGNEYPIKLNLLTGQFVVEIDFGKSFQGRDLKLLRKRVLAWLGDRGRVEWKPVILIHLSSLTDRISKGEFAYEYDRRFHGEMANGEIMSCWWGENGKPAGKPQPWREGGYHKTVILPYKEVLWDGLQKLDQQVLEMAKRLHSRIEKSAAKLLERIAKGANVFEFLSMHEKMVDEVLR